MLITSDEHQMRNAKNKFLQWPLPLTRQVLQTTEFLQTAQPCEYPATKTNKK
jgi:hypothetical protein